MNRPAKRGEKEWQRGAPEGPCEGKGKIDKKGAMPCNGKSASLCSC